VKVLTESETEAYYMPEEAEAWKRAGWRPATYAFADDLIADLLGYKRGDVRLIEASTQG
jgi:hypothetical protein